MLRMFSSPKSNNDNISIISEPQDFRQVSHNNFDSINNKPNTNQDEINLKKINAILKKIKNHKFVLHGNAKNIMIDDVIAKLDVSKSAAKIVDMIIKYYKIDDITFVAEKPYYTYYTTQNSESLITAIANEIRNKTHATTNTLFGGLGARESTTATLYEEILAICEPKSEKVNLSQDRPVSITRF